MRSACAALLLIIAINMNPQLYVNAQDTYIVKRDRGESATKLTNKLRKEIRQTGGFSKDASNIKIISKDGSFILSSNFPI